MQSYQRCSTVTPSGANNHPFVFDALLIGGAGNVVLVQEDGREAVLTGLLAGHVYPVKGVRVNSAGTTATNIVALRVDS